MGENNRFFASAQNDSRGAQDDKKELRMTRDERGRVVIMRRPYRSRGAASVWPSGVIKQLNFSNAYSEYGFQAILKMLILSITSTVLCAGQLFVITILNCPVALTANSSDVII